MKTASYDAFISYSRAGDGKLAPQLQLGLERLAKPWSKRRALRVFRDESGLSASPDLWDSIVTALDEARWFVVMASPDAAASIWVNREIEHWLASAPDARERMLLVLTDGAWRWDDVSKRFGEESTAVPPAMRHAFEAEPRHVDLNWARDDEHLDLRRADFRSAVADLAAPIHGIAKDELESDDIRLHRRTVRLRRAAIASLATFAAVVAVLAVVAFFLRERALDSERAAAERAAVASSLALAAQSELQLETGHVLGSLLAIESRRVSDLDAVPSTADAALLRAATRLPALIRELPAVDDATAIAFAPTGDQVAVGRSDGAVEVHGFDESAPTVIDGGDGSVVHVTFDPAGAELRWYDGVEAHRYVMTSGDHDRWPLAVDGRLLAVSADAATIVTSPVEQFDSVLVKTAFGEERLVDFGGFVSSAALSSDASLLAAVHDNGISVVRWRDDGLVAVLDVEEALRPYQRFFDEEVVTEMSFADDDRTIHLAGENAILGDDFREPVPWFGSWTPLEQQSFRFDLEGLSTLIASTGDGGRVADESGNVVDLALYPVDYDTSATLTPERLVDGAFSTDGSRLATIDEFGRAQVWDVAKRLGSGVVRSYDFETSGGTIEGATTALASDGRLVVGNEDGSISVVGIDGSVESIDIDPGQRVVAGFARDGSIVATSTSRTVVVDTSRGVRSPDLPPGGTGLALAPGRGEIVIASVNAADAAANEVAIRRRSIVDGATTADEIRTPYSAVPDPERLANLEIGPDTYLPVSAFVVVVDPTERRIAIELGDRVAVHDIETGRLITELNGARAPFAFSPSGSQLAVDFADRPAIVDVGDVADDTQGERIPLDVEDPLLFSFSDDGSVLAALGDRRVRVVDPTTGLRIVDGLGAGFSPVRYDVATSTMNRGIAFDGPFEIGIATAPTTGATSVETATWSLDPLDLEETVCGQAGRNLTQDEWSRFFPGVEYRVSCPAFPSGV